MVIADLDRQRSLRLAISGIVVISLFFALFARLFYLQVVDGSNLAAAAEANQVRTVYDEAPRGRILDRNGKVLVASREVDAITVERDVLIKNPDLLERVAPVLQTTAQGLQDRFNDSRNASFGPAVVASHLDKGIIATFRERQSEFPGVHATTLVERWYPNGPLAAHVLGYVGEINQDELAAKQDAGYRMGESIGKTGLEAAYEQQLRGQPGTSKIEVDSMGRAVRVLERSAPHPGNDLVLSIDLDAQRAAEEALTQASAAVKQRFQSDAVGQGGAVVAVDPRQGDVLAMASFPSYDPGAFVGGIPGDLYRSMVDPNGARPLNNRAIQGTYAAGSTFKLVTLMAGLEAGLITPGTTISDGGEFFLGNQRFQNAQNKAYGTVDMRRSLVVSSDVYYYRLAANLWNARERHPDAIQEEARKLGLGRTQNFPLTGESPGRIPDPESRRKMHEEMPNAFPEGNWYAGDNVNLSIGQGDTLLTPLQIANMYGAFSQDGKLWTPRLVMRVVSPDGQTLEEPAPRVLQDFPIDPAMKAPIQDGLVGVVSDREGTAYNAFRDFDKKSFSVAGKTGTAQVDAKGDTALFAAYGPVEQPRVAMSVVLEQGGFGSQSAAPVAAKVMSVIAGQGAKDVQLQDGVD